MTILASLRYRISKSQRYRFAALVSKSALIARKYVCLNDLCLDELELRGCERQLWRQYRLTNLGLGL